MYKSGLVWERVNIMYRVEFLNYTVTIRTFQHFGFMFFIPPQTKFGGGGGVPESRCPSVRLSVHPFTISKKSSSTKLPIRFQSNFTEMIFRSCSFKILQKLNSVKNSRSHWNRVKKNLKIFLSQTVRARAFIFGM